MKLRANLTGIVLVLLALLGSLHTASAYYDPSAQRWLNRDPISERGFFKVAQTQFESLRPTAKDYVYVLNSPVDQIDPEGLWQVCCRAIRNNPGDSSTTRTGRGLFKHCDLRNGPCDNQNDESYPAEKNCDPKCPSKLDNGTDCCKATDKDISDCLTRNPYSPGYGIPGSNCQANTLQRLSKCCLKSKWIPSWYAYPWDDIEPIGGP